jgi:zinc transporter, ZIP family
MLHYLEGLNPVLLALLATVFTWFTTSLGASVVFFLGDLDRKFKDGMLGFAAGIMIAASFWSLLEPAFTIAEDQGYSIPWIPVTGGFLAGAAFLFLIDKLLPHLHFGLAPENAEGIKTQWNRNTLLVLAITLHNIPEGLAVGVAFASIADTSDISMIMPAIILAIGIGIQNIPEGAAVSLPLRRDGMSKSKAFFWGQFSGMVEVFGGLVGVIAVMAAHSILPYALAFSAGAMIYVVIEELIPQAQSEGKTDIPTIGAILGFSIMMILDNALG